MIVEITLFKAVWFITVENFYYCYNELMPSYIHFGHASNKKKNSNGNLAKSEL